MYIYKYHLRTRFPMIVGCPASESELLTASFRKTSFQTDQAPGTVKARIFEWHIV